MENEREAEQWTAPGATVIVRAGVGNAEGGEDLGGRLGRVIGVDPRDAARLRVAWDSITLRAMTLDSLMIAMVEGRTWWEAALRAEDLAPAEPRDSTADATRARNEWQHAIDQEEPITGMLYALRTHGRRVLARIRESAARERPDILEAWHHYLVETLTVPFIAEVSGDAFRPIRDGDRVTVRAVAALDPQAGTLVRVEHRRAGSRDLPLSALRVPTPSASNYLLVYEYAAWHDEPALPDDLSRLRGIF